MNLLEITAAKLKTNKSLPAKSLYRKYGFKKSASSNLFVWEDKISLKKQLRIILSIEPFGRVWYFQINPKYMDGFVYLSLAVGIFVQFCKDKKEVVFRIVFRTHHRIICRYQRCFCNAIQVKVVESSQVFKINRAVSVCVFIVHGCQVVIAENGFVIQRVGVQRRIIQGVDQDRTLEKVIFLPCF